MTRFLFGALLLTLAATAWSEPTVQSATVVAEPRAGTTWNKMAGTLSAVSSASVDQLLAVIQDWESYPRLFPQIREVRVERRPSDVLLSEVVVVSALGLSATNRFTLRLVSNLDPVSGKATVTWTQHQADGSIDDLKGGWTLTPQTVGGKPSVLVQYQTASTVRETFPGQAGFVAPFYAGELKKVVAAVLDEAQKRGRP